MALDDRVQAILAFEQGELSEDAAIGLFQEMLNDGMVWQLQGVYGRTAMRLVDAGLLEKLPACVVCGDTLNLPIDEHEHVRP